jgi:PPIC-type PPIASE domain
MTLRSLVRAPALHFLLAGALLFALRSVAEQRRPATADGATVSDDELLYREALALGVDRRDPAVRERLVRLGGFVGEERDEREAQEAEARRLGLEHSDLVVHRHLAEVMRLAAGRLDAADYPTEAELAAYLTAHADAFRAPARVRFTQVYLARDRHGTTLEADAARLLAELRREHVPPVDAAALGDASLIGATVGPIAAADLDRQLGPGFSASLDDAPVGSWFGPVRSSYGLHLIWVEERTDASVPSLDSVRAQVLHHMLRERSTARARERIAALRARSTGR